MTQGQNTRTVLLSMENVEELLREMFKEQEQAHIKILSSCTDTSPTHYRIKDLIN